MSFDVGPAHLVLAVAGLLLMWRSKQSLRRTLAIAFACFAAGGALLSTDLTSWLWANLRLPQYMQFPWRALVLPGLFLPLLAIFALERIGRRWTVAVMIALAVINLSHTEPKGYLKFDDEFYSPASLASKGLNTTTYEEFEPRWVTERPPYYTSPLIGLTGPIEVATISNRTIKHEFRVKAANRTAVESAIFYYPGWTVMIDDMPTSAAPVPVRGTMQFEIPAGEHKVIIELQMTPVRQATLLASTLTGLLLAGACVYSRKNRVARPVGR